MFLIDHAWTYRLNEARAALAENENLLNRMVALMNIKPANLEDDEKANEAKSITERKINAVMKAMWKHNQTYKLSTEKLVSHVNLVKSIRLLLVYSSFCSFKRAMMRESRFGT